MPDFFFSARLNDEMLLMKNLSMIKNEKKKILYPLFYPDLHQKEMGSIN